MIYIGVLIVIVSPPPSTETPEPEQPVRPEQPRADDPALIYVSCEVCGWRDGYETIPSAKMGLGAHRGWCKRGHGRKLRPFG